MKLILMEFLIENAGNFWMMRLLVLTVANVTLIALKLAI
jgi:hypothetical protein